MSAVEIEPAGAGGLEASLPSSWYTTEEIFRLEKERIFAREWLCVGREEELPKPGSHRVVEVLGESLLLLRNREGRLRAFYNVCRHRGARLCRPPEAAGGAASLPGGIVGGRIVCPYHQWAYDFDGRLIAAPHLGDRPGFERAAFHLYPAGIDAWAGFVFVHLTPDGARPLREQLGAGADRVCRYPLGELRIGATLRYEVAANWKVVCENYNECYHCGAVHPELCAVVPAFREHGGGNLDWPHGVPHRLGAYTFTRSGTSRRRPFAGLDAEERVRHKGEVFYPTLFLALSCDYAVAFLLQPRGASRTDIICHFLFEPQEIARADFDPADASEFWDVVNGQDWRICESVQQGICARVHHFGYYAPMEDYNLDLRRYVLERLGPPAAVP
jgi:glycine betaine catabolism A